MDVPDLVDALKNVKSGRYFILVEDQVRGGQVRVINSTGNAVVLPRELFEANIVQIGRDDYASTFDGDQLAGLARFRERLSDQAEEERNRATKDRVKRQASTSSSTSTRTTRAKTIHRGAAAVKGGIVDRWQGPKLTFYRHRISPLRGNDRFSVTVTDVGEFVMSRDEFERDFNEVIMSKSYRSEGHYSYPKPPEHSLKFLRS